MIAAADTRANAALDGGNEPAAGRLPDAQDANLWRDLVEHADDLIFALDRDGRFTAINPAGERLLGHARDELLTMTLAELLAPESRATASELLGSSTGADPRPASELQFTAADGRPVTVELRVRPTMGVGAPRGFQGIGRDVTHRRQAQEALEQSEHRFRVLVENSADGLLLVSPEGRVFFASTPVVRWLGRSPADLVGRDLVEFVHPGDRDRVNWVLAEAVEQPATALYAEYRCRHGDGSWRLHEAVLINHLDQPGINAIVVNFRDVTEGRAAVAALHESEQRFRAVFESALMGIARVSLEGDILEVNRAVLEMSGLTKADVIGRPITAFLHADDVDSAVAEFGLLASGQRSGSRAERRFLASDGRMFWANVTAAVVRNEAGGPQFVLAILENITERKHAEAELRETNQRLSVWVQELEQRTREIGLLSDMGDLLQACRSAEEACSVIVPITAKLFPDSAGVVSIVDQGASGLVDPVARWRAAPSLGPFGLTECWALRRGRPHVVMDRDQGPLCRHLEALEGGGAMCVPMMAHGELLGILSLVVPDGGTLTDPRQRLVTTVAEHVSLALANLRLEESLRSQSIRDPLTGLFNRRYMEESLEREMRRAVRSRASVGIIMLDIDHFKTINDAHGHDAGDAVLRAVGAVLQRSIRAEDIACRYGGEEFTLILPEASLHEAAQRADYLRHAVNQLVVPHRRQTLPSVTLSAGVAIYPDNGPTADAVLRAADTALYQAKLRGRDRVVLNQTGGLFPDSIVEFGRRG